MRRSAHREKENPAGSAGRVLKTFVLLQTSDSALVYDHYDDYEV
jgi:hypothetical protein